MDKFMWKSSQYRRKHQRALNKTFRELNNLIKKDEKFKGRYTIVQEYTKFFEYDRDFEEMYHPKEYYLVVAYHFKDNKTGVISKSFYDHAMSLYEYRLFEKFNNFN